MCPATQKALSSCWVVMEWRSYQIVKSTASRALASITKAFLREKLNKSNEPLPFPRSLVQFRLYFVQRVPHHTLSCMLLAILHQAAHKLVIDLQSLRAQPGFFRLLLIG